MSRSNIISVVLYCLIITVYTIIPKETNEPFVYLFMWLCWFVGYSKNTWKLIK